mgnify:CR=1 FL=1
MRERAARLAITRKNPDQILEVPVAGGDVAGIAFTLFDAIGENFIEPAFIGAGISEVARNLEHHEAFLRGLAEHPVGVLEILGIGLRKVRGVPEW